MVVSVLVIGTLSYVLQLPWTLAYADEGYFYQHGWRVLQGQIAYGDFDEQYTPLASYLVAAAFSLGGVSIGTIVVFKALVQGAIAGLVYLAGTRLGIHRGLCLAAAVAHLAICRAAWPMGSSHWVATLISCGLLYSWCRDRMGSKQRRFISQGLWLGILVGVQHQKGVPIAVAVALLFALDALIARWLPDDGSRKAGEPYPLLPGLAWTTGTALGLMALVMGAHVAAVGAQPIVDMLVVQPFTGYREINQADWGDQIGMFPRIEELAADSWPLLLKWCPLLVPIATARAFLAWRARDRRRLRQLSMLSVMAIFSALTVLYRPDFIHIGMIAQPFLLLAAESLDAALRWLAARCRDPRPVLRYGLTALSLVLLLGLLAKLAHTGERVRARYPHGARTAIGRVAVRTAEEASRIEFVRAVLERSGERSLYAFPAPANLYLLVDARNPTRYDLFFDRMHGPKARREIIATLEAQRVPHIFVLRPDPSGELTRLLRRSYRCARRENAKGACVLYRRRARSPGRSDE